MFRLIFFDKFDQGILHFDNNLESNAIVLKCLFRNKIILLSDRHNLIILRIQVQNLVIFAGQPRHTLNSTFNRLLCDVDVMQGIGLELCVLPYELEDGSRH